MTYTILPTSDGSNTLFTSRFNASYHSIHGALEESKVVFIQLGLQYLANRGCQNIRLFEMGFGTGLNAALSFQFASQHGLTLHYTGAEAFPVPIETIQQTNLSSLFDAPYDQLYIELDHNGVLTTYCAKGIFKRNLKKVGFHLENHPGPGRKREITRAIKM